MINDNLYNIVGSCETLKIKLKEGNIYRLVLLNHLPSGKYIFLGKYYDGSYKFVGQYSCRQILVERRDFRVIN